jgi:hypothetical protein
MMYRGDVVPKDVNASVATIKTKRTIQPDGHYTSQLVSGDNVDVETAEQCREDENDEGDEVTGHSTTSRDFPVFDLDALDATT